VVKLKKKRKKKRKKKENMKRVLRRCLSNSSGCETRCLSSSSGSETRWRSTTILCVTKGDSVALIGDGQVTMGAQVMKPNANKVRKLGDSVVTGFAGSTADAITLFERLELKLEEFPGQLQRACVELAKSIRTEKQYREATMIVADPSVVLTLTGQGDVVEPHDGLLAIGSGSGYALAAAKALIDTDLTAEEIARKAMKIAGDMCVYTNHSVTLEVVQRKD
jgi:ATP-dependent HslUV protease subunit HslV